MDPVKPADRPAYPVIGAPGAGCDYGGLTKRELFAAMVMQGLVANERWFMNVVNDHSESPKGQAESLVAEAALAGADALLAELAKE